MMIFKPLRKRLEEASKQTSLRLDVIQQDYILSWLLVGIFEHPVLKSSLIFKGGTALKKGYFGKYRFSEDLDFSLRENVPEDLLQNITEACKNAETQMQEFAPVRLYVKRYEEKMPHPEGQQAFVINLNNGFFSLKIKSLARSLLLFLSSIALGYEFQEKSINLFTKFFDFLKEKNPLFRLLAHNFHGNPSPLQKPWLKFLATKQFFSNQS